MFAVPICFLFFPLAFVLVNDLSLVSRLFVFWWFFFFFNPDDFVVFCFLLLLFVSFCCMYLYFMFTAVFCQMFFH